MDDEAVLDAKRNHDLLEFLHLVDYGYSAELIGIDKINEADQYLVELRKDGTVAESHWFNAESGLRTRTVKSQSSARGEITITLDYGATTEAKGLLWESEITMKNMGQEMKMVITEVDVNAKIDPADCSVD
jgi:hypothetical protein